MSDDLISRQAAIDAKQEFRNPNIVRDSLARTTFERTYANGWNDCNSAWIDAINTLPSAEPGIIRCKDCRWGREVCGNIECSVDSNMPEYHGYEWFCPNGERKQDV